MGLVEVCASWPEHPRLSKNQLIFVSEVRHIKASAVLLFFFPLLDAAAEIFFFFAPSH